MKRPGDNLKRRSPVEFSAVPETTERRNDWTVVMEYQDEGDGPHLIDLSHCAKWDVQDRNVEGITPMDMAIPDAPGRSVFKNGVLINRMNRTQASVWFLSSPSAGLPKHSAFTDVTDSCLLLALQGREVFRVLEKLTALDIQITKPPCLIQGPVSHVPCQIVNLCASDNIRMVLIACSRGYGYDMVDAILDAGDEWGIRPAGEKRFTGFIESAAI